MRLVINKMKGIFATNHEVHDPSGYRDIIEGRVNSWRTLDWPNGLDLNLEYEQNTNLKSTLLDQIDQEIEDNDRSEIPQTEIDNLFGFTAFYRGAQAGDDDARKYSMTSLGSTRVL